MHCALVYSLYWCSPFWIIGMTTTTSNIHTISLPLSCEKSNSNRDNVEYRSYEEREMVKILSMQNSCVIFVLKMKNVCRIFFGPILNAIQYSNLMLVPGQHHSGNRTKLLLLVVHKQWTVFPFYVFFWNVLLSRREPVLESLKTVTNNVTIEQNGWEKYRNRKSFEVDVDLKIYLT